MTEHLFSVDVEEYFQVSAFERVVDPAQWERMPSRVEANVDALLELLERFGTVGTFFTVGWVARKHPSLVRRIAAAGHEIASHSYWHRRVSALTPEQFRADVRECKAVLEDVSGQAVLGFRAPSFSILPGGEWAFDVLLDEGFRYDSSLFPIRRPGYGYPAAPTEPHVIERPGGVLLELPMATLRCLGMRLPAAGGGYLRQLPLAIIRHAFRELGRRGESGMFYVHPWEIDAEQPRLDVSWLTRLRHYGGIPRTMPRLERLLAEFRFTSVARRYGLAMAPRDAEWTPPSTPLSA